MLTNTAQFWKSKLTDKQHGTLTGTKASGVASGQPGKMQTEKPVYRRSIHTDDPLMSSMLFNPLAKTTTSGLFPQIIFGGIVGSEVNGNKT